MDTSNNKEYKIFNGERVFVISDSEEKCFKSHNGVGTRVTDAKHLNELFDLFEQFEAPEMYVFSENPEREMQFLTEANRRIEAVGCLVFNNNNDLLLIYRLGYWDLPKGKMEKGESEISTAYREVEEECGITGIEIVKKVAETYHTYKIREERVIKRTTWFEAKYSGNQTPVPQIEENITEIMWVPENSINDYLPKMYASLRDLFSK